MDKGKEVAESRDFMQSANALFSFMKKMDYLKEIVNKKYIAPRYCEENIKYLKISKVEQIVLPMKCFCDIKLKGISSHQEIYGDYGIGLNKSWGEEKGIQPILYLNENSYLVKYIQKLGEDRLQNCIKNKQYDDKILDIMRYIKPIRGKMNRQDENGNIERLDCLFHDEKEWRYVPNIKSKDYEKFPPIMSESNKMFDISNKLAEHKEYALTFEYKDIRYFLLKNSQDRDDFINFVMELDTTMNEKNLLISKIIVYEEEMGDW